MEMGLWGILKKIKNRALEFDRYFRTKKHGE